MLIGTLKGSERGTGGSALPQLQTPAWEVGNPPSPLPLPLGGRYLEQGPGRGAGLAGTNDALSV